MWNKDPFLRIKRDVKVSIVQLGFAEAGDEEEEEEEEENFPTILLQSLVHQKGRQQNQTEREIVPKKTKEKVNAQIDEVPRRKRNFLADVTVAAKKVKVHFELICI